MVSATLLTCWIATYAKKRPFKTEEDDSRGLNLIK